MFFKRWLLILCAISLLAVVPGAAEELTPTETIKKPIDKIVALLRDPAYQKPGEKEIQRQKIWETAKPMFDFNEISQRTVGEKNWDTFTEKEKKEFTHVFSQFLGNTYIDKMQGEYHNERIQYGAELVRKPLALVRTKLVRESVEIPIDYRMRLENGHWLIYDILVEGGVSLVKNYRVQFQSILQKETPAQLIQRLKKKLE